MLHVILFLLVGLGISYFASQNATVVPLGLGGGFTILEVPIYIVAIGFVILGLLVGWVVSAASNLSTSRALQGKDTLLQEARKRIDELQEVNRNLELEVEHLKEKEQQDLEQHTHEEEQKARTHPNFLDHLKHGFS